MVVAGYILVAIGSVAGLIGEILMLTLAYRRGIGWLMGFLLLGPFCWLALVATDFKSTLRPFALAVMGLIVAGIGCAMAGIEYCQ